MSPPPDVDGDISPRFAERRRELEAATSSKITSAAEAGRALALAGDLLRRSEALGDARMDVEIALEKVELAAAESFVESIVAKAEHQKLSRGLEDAFEALIEDGEERVLYMNSAENALSARDALASVRASMTVSAPMSDLLTKLDGKLREIDGKLPKNARLLVALNSLRRREMGSLDAAERAASWWYSARVQCDFLISLYRLQETERVDITQKHNAAHLATCAECQRDVESASIAYTPEHVAASSLWRREHGHATAAEIAFMDAHAKTCNDCKRAMEATAVPDEG